MSRRTAFSSLFLLLITALMIAPAVAASHPAHSVVYPTGVFPDDVQNVQAAVDKGGVVLLKAVNVSGAPTSFNFSTDLAVAAVSGGINLTTDVTILGEHSGRARTTILGGFAPILGLVPVKSSIQGIVFERPFDDAIQIAASTGTDVIGNYIHNVVPVKVRVGSGRIITFGDGIDVGSYGDNTGITGKVRVMGNVIDGLGAIFSNGVQFDTVGAESEVSGNVVVHLNSPDTETGGGITLIRIQKPIVVSNNLIIPGASSMSDADGIFVGGDMGARYKVFSNFIYCDGTFADGIDITGGDATGTTGTFDAVIANNFVTTKNASSGAPIAVFDLVTNALIEGNFLFGDGYFAMGITTYGFETNTASLNRFVDNHLEGFSSSFADIFFDANAENNRVIGKCKSLVDLGTGNTSTCGEAMKSAAASETPQRLAGMQAKSRNLLQLQHVRLLVRTRIP
jgi:hypothetical protein